MKIPFNKPYMTGKELDYIKQAYENGWLAGNGQFTKNCQKFLEDHIGSSKVLLTHSGTHALELSALLIDIKPGDEIIMPSFTFVSTATAFVLRGAIPVFVDIRPDTCNIDESLIEQAITSKTKAIVPVHYAGVGCEMDKIMEIANRHGLIVIEDAAHGIGSKYKGKALGSFGQFAALSFHETKNIISGEGGALLINDEKYIERAEVIADKGTDRSKFFKGEVDKYTWVDVGSSYYPSELISAFLFAQLESLENISEKRLNIWDKYHEALKGLELEGEVRRPIIPEECVHNAHMYYLILPSQEIRDGLIKALKRKDIHPVFHYLPLHNSRGFKSAGCNNNVELKVTEEVSGCLVRLPLWIGVEDHQKLIIENVIEFLG